MGIIYLNGEFIEENTAKISVFDRGFMFGDSVYDVIPLYQEAYYPLEPDNRHFASLDKHIERLQGNLREIGITMPFSPETFNNTLLKLLELNELQAQDITFYVQITRGTQIPRSHQIAQHIKPTVLITCTISSRKEKHEITGLKAITMEDNRWKGAHIKSNSLLANVLAAQQAKEAGVDEAIYLRGHQVLECSSGNLFICKRNQHGNIRITTPPVETGIVDGVTRDILLTLANRYGLNAQVEETTLEELLSASEVWVTGATKEIRPIVYINGQPIGYGEHPYPGEKGPLWSQLWSLYERYRKTGKFETAMLI